MAYTQILAERSVVTRLLQYCAAVPAGRRDDAPFRCFYILLVVYATLRTCVRLR